MKLTFDIADLFAGAGGMSEGAVQALKARGFNPRLVAVNHWPTAVETHTVNHPSAQHYCTPVEALDPRVAVPGGKLDLLMAAPECTHHSTARGGKPINDQSRASAWHILRWLSLLRVESVLIENVPEFAGWGPLNKKNKPIKSQKGTIFNAFLEALRAHGFKVEYKILNAADYGAATTRRRLFIVGVRGNRVPWPAQTHSKTGGPTLFGQTKKWRAAREVIDWSLPGTSIFSRKKPLSAKTIERILQGLHLYGGDALKPFLVTMTHGARHHDIETPMPTITTAHRGEMGVVEPVIVTLRNHMNGRTMDEPIPTVTAEGNHHGIAQPFLIPFYGERPTQAPRTHSIDEPVPVIPASGDGKFAVIEPFVLSQAGGGVARPVGKPMPTILTDGAHSIIEPFIIPPRHMGDGAVDSIDRPIRTVTAAAGHTFGVVEPCIVKYNGTAKKPKSVETPLDTISTKDRFGLVQPVVNGYTLDIRFRMLQPHELAGAMSFPKTYVFTGTKGDKVKQIGNAVDCSMSRALATAIIEHLRPELRSIEREEKTA